MLERTLCGFAREGDVPGFEIPERYFTYVRTGDARPLEGVLEHNRLDLLSLALVTSHACQLLDEGPHAARGPREALGLGRIYLAGGRADDARRCFAAAGGLEPGVGPSWTTEGRGGSKRTRTAEARSHAVTVQAEALRAFALLARRARQFDDAAVAWQKVLALPGCPEHISREATSALAVHYEHRRRDFVAAKSFALRVLQGDRGSAREQATRHRVARLDPQDGRRVRRRRLAVLRGSGPRPSGERATSPVLACWRSRLVRLLSSLSQQPRTEPRRTRRRT
jgi:hypothetical protein